MSKAKQAKQLVTDDNLEIAVHDFALAREGSLEYDVLGDGILKWMDDPLEEED